VRKVANDVLRDRTGCTVSDNDLEVLNDLLSSSFPVLNVVNVRFRPPKWTGARQSTT